jgi:hypothetical protein
MPTPFMHLQLSEGLRSLALNRREIDGPYQLVFGQNWPAFYLGCVAPDFQTICGIPRAKTHFYSMPPESKSAAMENMLAAFPQLNPGQSLRPAHAGFIAGYLAHLQLDLIWHFDVIMPYFVNSPISVDQRHAYLLHVLLLTYLDNLAFSSLPQTAPDMLAAAPYDHWLPFAKDDQVIAWRNFLLEQMRPGGVTQTIQIFARRLRMTQDEFSAKLDDPGWMDEELFSRIPVAVIQKRLQESFSESLDLIDAYWTGQLGKDSM